MEPPLVWCFRIPLNHSTVIPGKLAIPPEADQPQAEASATRNPGKSKNLWIPVFAGMTAGKPRTYLRISIPR